MKPFTYTFVNSLLEGGVLKERFLFWAMIIMNYRDEIEKMAFRYKDLALSTILGWQFSSGKSTRNISLLWCTLEFASPLAQTTYFPNGTILANTLQSA